MSSRSASESSAPSSSGDDVYEISAVARITGLSTHNLRVWERRHKVVEPVRTDTKRRLYSRDDVRKLGLLKALVDSGHSISQLASLNISQLEQRLNESGQSAAPGTSPRSDASGTLARRCRLAVAGHFVRSLFDDEGALSDQFRVISGHDSTDQLRREVRPLSVDAVIIEEATLFDERVEAIQQMLSKIKAQRAIIVYQFAPRPVISRIEADFPQITALRAPANATEIRLACLAGMSLSKQSRTKQGERGKPGVLDDSAEALDGDTAVAENAIPERYFSDSELAAIARLASSIKCECPQHLASLLSGLLAFETYSSQCENRNEDDAKLHAYLHGATATARATLEKALVAVLDSEDIHLNS